MSTLKRAGNPLSSTDQSDIRRDIGLPLPTSGDAGSGQVVTGGDSRLTDARTPSGPAIAAATSKTTLADADSLPISDSAASGGLKRLTWANLKAALNGLYQAVLVSGTNIKTINGNSLLGSGDLTVSEGGGGATNLTYTPSATGGTVVSDTGTDAALPLADGTNAGLMAPAQHTKLAGVAAGATANATDAQLRDRATHTGTQAISTVAGLQTALDGKEASGTAASAVAAHAGAADPHPGYALESALATVATSGAYGDLSGRPTLGTAAATDSTAYATAAQGTDSREWTAATVDQAEAEAGTATTRRAWTAQRVWQAITKALGGVTVTNTPTSGQVLKATGTTTAAWGTDDTGGGGGSTDLSWSASPTGGVVASSSGADASLTLADGTNAGLMSPLQHTKLAGIASGATANATDAQLRDRATHTGTQLAATIGDSTAAGRAVLTAADAAAQRTALGLGTAATTAATDYATAAQGTDARTPSGPGIAAATEDTTPQDADNFPLADSTASNALRRITWGTIKTALGTIFASRGAIGSSGLTMSTARLLGRSTAGAGGAEEIAIGSGLLLSGGTLTATGGGGGGSYEVATFADLPGATTVTAGRTYTVLGALCAGGVLGTRWASDGAVWLPAGRQMIYHSRTQVDGVSGGSTAEQILASVLLPAGLLVGVREFGVRSRWVFSGTDPANKNPRIRIGTTGTASDTVVYSNNFAGAVRAGVLPRVLMVLDNTTLQSYEAGITAVSVSPDAQTTQNGAPATLTVPSLTNALYISLSVQQGASPVSTASLSAAAIFVE